MVIRNASGKKIGEVKDTSTGRRAYDKHGKLLGEYNSLTGTTRDASGRRVGEGDLTMSLVG